MQKPKVWWKSWPVALIGVAVVCAGVVPELLPEKKPVAVEAETEIYLKPVDGHGITTPALPLATDEGSGPPHQAPPHADAEVIARPNPSPR
jgi:hypothetical protein